MGFNSSGYRVDEYDDIEVIVMTPEEWSAAGKAAVEATGFTWEEIEDMSRRNNFETLAARKIWLILGGKRP